MDGGKAPLSAREIPCKRKIRNHRIGGSGFFIGWKFFPALCPAPVGFHGRVMPDQRQGNQANPDEVRYGSRINHQQSARDGDSPLDHGKGRLRVGCVP